MYELFTFEEIESKQCWQTIESLLCRARQMRLESKADRPESHPEIRPSVSEQASGLTSEDSVWIGPHFLWKKKTNELDLRAPSPKALYV